MNNKNTKIPTVKELRQTGHKVRIQRFRPYVVGPMPIFLDDNNARINGLDKQDVYQNGGITVVSVRKPTGEEVTGISECSLDDPFVKRTGVEIGIARALELPIPAY